LYRGGFFWTSSLYDSGVKLKAPFSEKTAGSQQIAHPPRLSLSEVLCEVRERVREVSPSFSWGDQYGGSGLITSSAPNNQDLTAGTAHKHTHTFPQK